VSVVEASGSHFADKPAPLFSLRPIEAPPPEGLGLPPKGGREPVRKRAVSHLGGTLG
jgi:hypothetical protein